MNRYLIIFASLFLTTLLTGHGDLHERIESISIAIKNNPDSAELYVIRGELYIQHDDYKHALKDYKKCKKLGIVNEHIEYNIALIYYKLRKFKKANKLLDKILTNDKQNIRAYRLQGQVYSNREDYENAAIAFQNVIKYAVPKIPENYFEASNAYAKCEGELMKNQAHKVIEEGIVELGELRTFYDRLIELNLKKRDYTTVLLYQNKIIDQADRKERAYYNRGLTYIEIGDTKKAEKDFRTANNHIMKLNSRIQNQFSVMELKKSISAQLNKFKN